MDQHGKKRNNSCARCGKVSGHIACSSESKSEIVLPIFKNNKTFGVLDIDSAEINTFDQTDKKYLEKGIKIIEEKLI